MEINHKQLEILDRLVQLADESIEGELDLSEAMWEIREKLMDILKELQRDD